MTLPPRQNHRSAQQQWPVIMFTVIYMSAAIMYSLVTENREFMFYTAVMIALIAVVAVLHLRIGLTTALLWALSIWGLSHMAGGLLPVPEGWPINGDIRVLYSLWLIPDLLKYDHVVHAYGFGITAWACWQILATGMAAAGQTIRPTLGVMTLCATAAMGFGALNEIVEFMTTLAVPEHNVGGYANTSWDMVCNTVGAVTAATAIWLTGR